MFERYYGKCNVLGDKDFVLLIEYKYALRKNKGYYGSCECSAFGFDPDEYDTVIIGKDIVTGTPIFSMLPSRIVSTLEDAAKEKIIRKGKLIVKTCERVSIDYMSNYLNKMTNKEANEYIKKVNELKVMYSEAVTKEKRDSNNRKANEKIQKENLEVEKSIVKKLAIRINK